jgi:ribose-phosphate pyrophosphokinase
MAIHKIKIFTGRDSEYLAKKIAASFGTTLGQSEVLRFSDGEFQPCYNESIRGCTVFIIQSTFPPSDNLMELLMMIDAARRASAHQVVAVMPYFGWARQDRKDRPRVPIGAKLVANMLMAAGVDRVMTMDLHADQIQGFFDVPVDALYASGIFVPYIKSLNIETSRSQRPTWAAPSGQTPIRNCSARRSSFRTRSAPRPMSWAR